MDSSEILELAQHKLIILYIVNGADHLFNDEELSRFILEKDLMNYFFLQQYIKELLDTDLLLVDENNNYYITPDGKIALNLFLNKISKDITESIKVDLVQFKKDKIYKQSIHAEYFKDDYDRFYVDLALKENSTLMFSLSFEVPTEDYAKIICNNFKKFPEEYYLKIIKLFDI